MGGKVISVNDQTRKQAESDAKKALREINNSIRNQCGVHVNAGGVTVATKPSK